MLFDSFQFPFLLKHRYQIKHYRLMFRNCPTLSNYHTTLNENQNFVLPTIFDKNHKTGNLALSFSYSTVGNKKRRAFGSFYIQIVTKFIKCYVVQI